MWYVPSNTARDKHLIRSSHILKAYDYLMGLKSDVKRQLSLLLSSVNKHIVWPEVSCHDVSCTINGNFKVSFSSDYHCCIDADL